MIFNPAFIWALSVFYIGVYLLYSAEPLRLFVRSRLYEHCLYLDKYSTYTSSVYIQPGLLNSIDNKCWCLLIMVSVCVAHAQNSFYHFKTVVAHITFALLADTTFLESSNMPIADWIRGKTVIVTGQIKINYLRAEISSIDFVLALS